MIVWNLSLLNLFFEYFGFKKDDDHHFGLKYSLLVKIAVRFEACWYSAVPRHNTDLETSGS